MVNNRLYCPLLNFHHKKIRSLLNKINKEAAKRKSFISYVFIFFDWGAINFPSIICVRMYKKIKKKYKKHREEFGKEMKNFSNQKEKKTHPLCIACDMACYF